MKNHQEIVTDLAKVAFTAHYEATKKPGWASAASHWFAHPQARELWEAIIIGVLVGAERAGAPALPRNAASALLARMARPGGPMTPLPERDRGRTFVGPGDMTPLPPKATFGDPQPFPDDPRPDPTSDPTEYRKWKTRNFGRIYGYQGKPPIRTSELMNAPYGDIPPGLAIERHDCEPSPEEREAERSKLARYADYMDAHAEEPDPHIAQSIREHNSGEPEE